VKNIWTTSLKALNHNLHALIGLNEKPGKKCQNRRRLCCGWFFNVVLNAVLKLNCRMALGARTRGCCISQSAAAVSGPKGQLLLYSPNR